MNIRKIKFLDIINPRKWKAILEAYEKKFIGGISLEFCEEVDMLYHTEPELAHNLAATKKVSVDYCQMVVYRANKCRDCVEAGSCHHCGCTTPENMFSISNWCSAGKWPAHENEEDFKQHKKKEDELTRKIAADISRV